MDTKTWDKWHKILGGLLIAALIYIVFLQGCGGDRCPEIEDSTHTEIHIDTVPFDTAVFTYHDVPVPKPYYVPIYDTISIYDTTEPDFNNILDYYSIYIDTLRDSIMDIFYEVIVRGYMDSIKIERKINQPYSLVKTKTVTTLSTIIEKKPRYGLYIGLDVGGNENSFGYFKPELTLSSQRGHYSIGYNIPDKSITAGVKIKLLPLKR